MMKSKEKTREELEASLFVTNTKLAERRRFILELMNTIDEIEAENETMFNIIEEIALIREGDRIKRLINDARDFIKEHRGKDV